MESKADTPLMGDGAAPASEKHQQPQQPDGGCWAWLVLLGCFLVNGIIFGIINTFGILFVQLKEDMERTGVEDAASKCGKRREDYFVFSVITRSSPSLDWKPDHRDNILPLLPSRYPE